MASRVLLVMIASSMVLVSAEDRRDGLMDRLHSGMKFAQGLLGSESVALKVAEFVVRAFNPGSGSTSRPPPPTAGDNNYGKPEQLDNQESEESDAATGPQSAPLSAVRQLVRLLGLRPAQLGAVAVNALLFVSQLIATILAGPTNGRRPHRAEPPEEPTAWLLQRQSPPLQTLLAAARNDSLADAVQQLVQDQGSTEETSCLRLLACKIAPFVVRMQRAVFGKDADGQDATLKNTRGQDTTLKDAGGLKGAAVLYQHLPSRQQALEASNACERIHWECDLNEI